MRLNLIAVKTMLLHDDFHDIAKHICSLWLKIKINFTSGTGEKCKGTFHYALIFEISSHNRTVLCRLFLVKGFTGRKLEEHVPSGPILKQHNLVKLLLDLRCPWFILSSEKEWHSFQPFCSETWYAFPSTSHLYCEQQVVTKDSFFSTISLATSALKTMSK